MKYIAILLIALACVVAGLVGWPWWQSQQAYKAATQYIENQHAQNYTYVDFTAFPRLRVIPENIKSIEGLSHLDLPDTDVSDLSPLASMKSLGHINIRATKVKDLSVLKTLPVFTHIDMGKIPARDLSPLADCAKLEWLDISDTHTLSLEPVTRIANLNWLNLYRAMSDDGSQIYFEELMARGTIDIQPGNRFKENYIPR